MRRSPGTTPRSSCRATPPSTAFRRRTLARQRRRVRDRARYRGGAARRRTRRRAHSGDDLRQRRTARAAGARRRARQAHRDLPRRGRPRSPGRRAARARRAWSTTSIAIAARARAPARKDWSEALRDAARARAHRHVERRPRQPVRAARRRCASAPDRAFPRSCRTRASPSTRARSDSKPSRQLTETRDSSARKMVPFAGYDMPVQYPLGHHRRASAHARERRPVRRVAHGAGRSLAGAAHATARRRWKPWSPATSQASRPASSATRCSLNEDGGILDDLMVDAPASAR